MTTIVALDCESNGLHGPIFAAAASVQVDGVEATTWWARCPIHGPIDEFVATNVLPAIEAIPEDCDSGVELTAQWRGMYRRWEADLGPTLVIGHVTWPVEARFLWDAHRDAPFSGPYPLVDVASMLAARVGPTTATCSSQRSARWSNAAAPSTDTSGSATPAGGSTSPAGRRPSRPDRRRTGAVPHRPWEGRPCRLTDRPS